MAPIERLTQLATTVDTLPEAWVLVMGWLEEVGPNPTINIRPLYSADEDPRRFEVMVLGRVVDTVDNQ